jgi:phosphate starvation-inducible PhoH-like protein
MSKKNKKSNHNQTNSNEQDYIKDTSPIVYQKGKLKSELHIRVRPDLTDKQKELLKLINSKKTKIVFITGAAGTSKSYIAVLSSLLLLNDKRVSDLIYMRSVVESASKPIGHLPGTIDEKIHVFNLPLIDKLDEMLSKTEIDLLIKEKRIEGIPMNFLRGLNFSVKAIILDEAQNCTEKEIITAMTRCGQYSTMIICGDENQSDILNSGFRKIIDKFDDDESKEHGIQIFRFNEDDCVRSEIVKFIIKRLNKK